MDRMIWCALMALLERQRASPISWICAVRDGNVINYSAYVKSGLILLI